MSRQRHQGVLKRCRCARTRWSKCDHPWYLSFQWKGTHHRFCLDREVGKRLDSKGAALTEADRIKTEIRAGTFRRAEDVPEVPAPSPTPAAPITLERFAEIYFERREKPVSANDRSCVSRFKAFTPPGQQKLADAPLTGITADQVELFFARLRQERRAASTRNKYVQMVKAMFRWAERKGYIARNPVGDSETIRREKHAKRQRRLAPDVLKDGKIIREGEERRLLKVAGPHLQRLIIAALESGMRRGELLALTWADVNLERRQITVRAETTKTRTGRVLPISDRLAGVLEMARTAITSFYAKPEFRRLTDEERAAQIARSFVFGDEDGIQILNIKRAWETALLKAHGYLPAWDKSNRLSAESRVAVRQIDLHFHDLRHEAGSRLLEQGWPLHHVQEMLGHANVSQTSTYLNATRLGLQESMRRFQHARTCTTVAQVPSIDLPPVGNTDPAEDENPLIN